MICHWITLSLYYSFWSASGTCQIGREIKFNCLVQPNLIWPYFKCINIIFLLQILVLCYSWRNATQPTKNWKISTKPDPTQSNVWDNPTYGQVCATNLPVISPKLSCWPTVKYLVVFKNSVVNSRFLRRPVHLIYSDFVTFFAKSYMRMNFRMWSQ